VLAGGSNAILCGPATPDEFEGDPLGADALRCAYLDCPDDELTKRLRARGESEADIADELATAADLRDSGYEKISVADRSPLQVAEDVARWVRMHR
jgi:hypothetical protein